MLARTIPNSLIVAYVEALGSTSRVVAYRDIVETLWEELPDRVKQRVEESQRG